MSTIQPYVGIFADESGMRFLHIMNVAVDHAVKELHVRLMPGNETQYRECLAKVYAWDNTVVKNEVDHICDACPDAEQNFRSIFTMYVKRLKRTNSNKSMRLLVNVPRISLFWHEYFCNFSREPSVQNGSYFSQMSRVDRNVLCMDVCRLSMNGFEKDDFIKLQLRKTPVVDDDALSDVQPSDSVSNIGAPNYRRSHMYDSDNYRIDRVDALTEVENEQLWDDTVEKYKPREEKEPDEKDDECQDDKILDEASRVGSRRDEDSSGSLVGRRHPEESRLRDDRHDEGSKVGRRRDDRLDEGSSVGHRRDDPQDEGSSVGHRRDDDGSSVGRRRHDRQDEGSTAGQGPPGGRRRDDRQDEGSSVGRRQEEAGREGRRRAESRLESSAGSRVLDDKSSVVSRHEEEESCVGRNKRDERRRGDERSVASLSTVTLSSVAHGAKPRYVPSELSSVISSHAVSPPRRRHASPCKSYVTDC